jgi:hypothetical protein
MRIGDQITPKLAKGRESAAEPDSFVFDTYGIQFGGKKIVVQYRFKNYKLAYVVLGFDSDQFEDVVKAYTAKFGVAPHEVEEEPLTTRLGVNYTNYSVTWHTESGPFIVKRFGTTIKHGHAFLHSPAYEEEAKASEKEREEQLKSQL